MHNTESFHQGTKENKSAKELLPIVLTVHRNKTKSQQNLNYVT